MRVGQIPKCGCGKSKHPQMLCDGSHSQLTAEELQRLREAKAGQGALGPKNKPAGPATSGKPG